MRKRRRAADCRAAELARLAQTIDRWSSEVLASHHTSGASNGPTEAVSNLAKRIKRVA